jgi:hypothetical protein
MDGVLRAKAAALVALAGLLAAACSNGSSGGRASTGTPLTPTSTSISVETTTAATTVTAAEPAAFSASVSNVTAADLPASWRPGCPVGPERLRLLRLSHWDFDGRSRTGSLVVHADVVDDMTAVFGQLYEQRFPIRRMELVDVYGGDDRASMDADNTSAFNCRNAVASGPPRWSVHAYGQAIDVNPVENPYVQGGEVQPPAGAPYVVRSPYRPGMAVAGGTLTSAFASVGWSWGGEWAGTPDYQHFSATGG